MSYSWYSLKTCYAFSDPPLEEDDLPPGEWVCHRCRVTPSEVSAHLHFTSRLPMTAFWHVFVSFFFSVLPFFLLCVWFLPVLRLRKQFFFFSLDWFQSACSFTSPAIIRLLISWLCTQACHCMQTWSFLSFALSCFLSHFSSCFYPPAPPFFYFFYEYC